MGNRTGPAADIYGVYDHPNFPPGETPKILKASFTGIYVGTLWNDTYLLPKNGTFHLEQYDQYNWAKAFPWGTISYMMGDTFCQVFMQDLESRYIFYGDIADSSAYWQDSYYHGIEERVWSGGQVAAAFIAPAPSPSAARMLAAFGMERGDRMFLEIFPEADKLTTFRFAHKEIGTNIRIKFDAAVF